MIDSVQYPKVRLDHYLANKYPDVSRSFLQKLCITNQVLVNGEPQKPGFKLRPTDKVKTLYDITKIPKIQDIDLRIIYQDDDVMIVDKPTGIISHSRGKYWDEPSVASFIRQHTSQDGDRAGIVHRLDRSTSGVMVCAKNPKAMRYLQKQFADRKVTKTYVAIVSGHLQHKEALIDMPIERNPKLPSTFRVAPNGKPSQTSFKVTKSSSMYDLVELFPKTGRTHQIRVHMAHQKCPILGDKLYGGNDADRLFLHAYKLKLRLPSGQLKTFTSPIPDEFRSTMEQQ